MMCRSDRTLPRLFENLMKPMFKFRLVVIVVLAALLLLLTDTFARQNSVWSHLDLLVDVRHEILNGYVEEPDQDAMVEAAVRGMIDSLNDPYTQYLPKDELEGFERHVRGSFSGIGAEVSTAEGRLKIITPLEDSPAWNAGVMAGDTILEIDGTSTLDMDVRDAVKLLTGERGTDVTIKVRRESGEEADITITRDTINIQTVRGFRRDRNQDYDYMMDDANRIGYIRVTQFSEPTVEQLRPIVEQLIAEGAQGLILDVRFDPGGLLSAAVAIADMFLPEGKTVVSIKGRNVPEQVYATTDDTIALDIPIVIIANEASASASEILTGALSDNGRALFVGARTFGKGSVQQVKMLDSELGALKITNAYYYLPSGRNIHRREGEDTWGVDPSPGAYVSMTPEEVSEMITVRREGDKLLRTNGNHDDETITPAWLEEELKDPQLAAAHRAILGKIETGDWPAVGGDNAEELIKQTKRANLQKRIELLRESLTKAEEELDKLENGDLTVEMPAASATDPLKVEEQVKAAETAPTLDPLEPKPQQPSAPATQPAE